MSARYEPLLVKLVTEFQERFVDLSGTTDVVNFVVNPFDGKPENICRSAVARGIVDITFELKVIDLQEKVELLILPLNWRLLICRRKWNCVIDSNLVKLPKQEFSVCCMVASKVTAYFGSSYLCEQPFSVMRTQSITRNCLSSEHLCDQMRKCLSAYKPRFDALTSSMHCQTSHLLTGGLALADYIKHYCYSLSRTAIALHSIINKNISL